MRSHQLSKTADGAAAIRALHRLYDRPIVFDDPFALDLTSAGWRCICENRFLHWLVIEQALRSLRPVAGQVLSRAATPRTALRKPLGRGPSSTSRRARTQGHRRGLAPLRTRDSLAGRKSIVGGGTYAPTHRRPESARVTRGCLTKTSA